MVRLDGAVENAVRLGVADVIADVVDTGATLRQAGLELVGEPILHLDRGPDPVRHRPSGNGPVTQLLRRLQGVLVARQYVMLAYDVRADQLDAAVALTPGIESPTVSAAAPRGLGGGTGDGRCGPRYTGSWTSCTTLGARAILVTDIHACRL